MKIIKYKKIRNKYRVYFDDDSSLDLYEDTILKYNFLIKKEFTEKEIDKIKKYNSKEEIIYLSIKYISTKMRSKKEINSYLLKKGYSKEEIDYALNRLTSLGLLNDELYAKAYIIDRFNLSTDGPNKIRNSLINEKIDETIINKYLGELSDKMIYDKLNRLVDKKIKNTNNYSGNILKMKITSYFISLGYNANMINDLLSNKNLVNNEKGVKEYKKLYDKYKNKYEGYELENIIRQKLYSKGYMIDEIKELID